ncbi:MAG: hypothetical protein ACKVS9_15830 [Phycisphaerae bacterium]
MKTFVHHMLGGIVAASVLAGGFAWPALGQDKPAKAEEPKAVDTKKDDAKKDDAKPASDGAPIELKLPKPAFKGTPKDAPAGSNLEKPRSGPRPPFLAPKGTKNLSQGKPVKSSDSEPIIGEIPLITDGDKEAGEGSYVELGPGLQHVTIDLGESAKIYAIVVWHYHMNARIYHDVVVQVAEDADFTKGVKTVYSNDHDNSAGMGVGPEKEYWETFEGRLIDAGGATGRFVRLYSKGSTADDQNHYTEVEVWGMK